ncbi:MAG TPA: barstar family protein [Nitrospira sp.]|jgi:RNAse (barnase) inhibitor barstar|nr:barstar family protein [Nitrospira sp.]
MAAHASPSFAAHLQSTKPPWTALLILQAGQRAESVVKSPEGFVRRVIRGSKCRSAAGLFSEVATALEFPDYFGHNWDALEECLADLEWLPAKGYVLCFTNPESILPDDEEEFATFLEVMSDAGEAWASGQTGQKPRPFHVVLTVSEQEKSKLMHRGLPRISAVPPGPSGRSRRRTG